jgi:serine phosphatase RsbU (regulator of sigma subunit)
VAKTDRRETDNASRVVYGNPTNIVWQGYERRRSGDRRAPADAPSRHDRRATDAPPVVQARRYSDAPPPANRGRRARDVPEEHFSRRSTDVPLPERHNRRSSDIRDDEGPSRRAEDEPLNVAVRATDVRPLSVNVRPPDALQREMRRIVESIYGPPLSRLPGLEIGRAYLNSWREDFRYGGDVVDVFHYGMGLTSLAMVDISGHGIDAAMYAGLTKHALRAFASRGFSARKCVRSLNRLCIENSTFEAAEDFYATVFFAIIASDRRSMQYVSAGHDAAFLIEPNRATQLAVTGPLIGLGAGALPIEQRTVATSSGMIVATVTDGFSEARNARGDFLGADAVLDVTGTLRSCDAGQQAEALTQYAVDFADGRLHDDVAALVVKIL